MNSKMKRRMAVVGGIIVIVIILLLAIVGGSSNARVVSVQDVAAGTSGDAKVQVTGVVVDNSYSVDEDGVLTFSIKPENAEAGAPEVKVSYDKGVSATFGNGVTAICTGRVDEQGQLVCSELVTKCPSKYENSSSALSLDKFYSYDSSVMTGKTVKVAGMVRAGSMADATATYRFTIEDAEEGLDLRIVFKGPLSDDIVEGTEVVVTGSLDEKGRFEATDVALEG